MRKKFSFHISIFGTICISVFILYSFFINLSSDTIILFLSNKLFLGQWINKGVFPLYNPYLFAGIPFAFDLGLGNLHPLNLLFALPYPISIASWASINSALFLFGFYYFFSLITKNHKLNILLVLMLFFSGNGFWRMNNPTIFAVISHYGLFFYSLSFLKKKINIRYFVPIVAGILMTLAGHIQFVLYGYLFGAALMIWIYKIPFRKIIIFYIALGFSLSWYFLLAFPIVIGSTRITKSVDYLQTGDLQISQLVQLVFPFAFGNVRNGSSWNVGPKPDIVISVLWSLFAGILILKRKITLIDGLLLVGLFVLSFGFVSLPLMRNASQIFILIHITLLIIIAKNEKTIESFIKNNITNRSVLFTFVICTFAILFFSSPLFIFFFHLIKKNSLFFDTATISAIGVLFAKSFVPVMLVSIAVFIAKKYNKYFWNIFLVLIFIEGVFVNYQQNYFIPQSILSVPARLPQTVDKRNYRIQTASDVVPFFGFHSYVRDFLFRPPFSKEKPIFDIQEAHNFTYLKQIFKYIPSSWAMVDGIKTVQGYNTFVPKKLADVFRRPSSDYEEKYSYIIERNPLFKTNDNGTQINALETSRITLEDARWKDLSVRYVISDRKLDGYELISKERPLVYEISDAAPIYYLEDSKNIKIFALEYEDPNQMIFQIDSSMVGKKLVIVMNPDGFLTTVDGAQVRGKKEDFKMIIPISKSGILRVYYSPFEHLMKILNLS